MYNRSPVIVLLTACLPVSSSFFSAFTSAIGGERFGRMADTSIFKEVDLQSKTNNFFHKTSEISLEQLIVRRGQAFVVTLNLSQPFNQNQHGLFISAMTGKNPSEEKGTLSFFGLGVTDRSPLAKAVWKVELHKDSSPKTGKLILSISAAPDSPIGEYVLTVKHRDQETLLAMPVVLFNPWCTTDWVYMKNEKEANEYVLNEQGVIFVGSHNYIFPCDWGYGQFEDMMIQICLKILDINPKSLIDPGEDASARCNPIYVGRVVSAMINSQDDKGVLEGRWNGLYSGGHKPTHWTGSHGILKKWFKNDFSPVKYGQCWVFAAVMCSVMRLLGIPCRVISNFESAHDTNKNLTIDTFHGEDGVRPKPTHDSVWNFHVWTEAWMRRPDLSKDGKYDGWQVLDPTPQETSDGVYCCGPAPVKAILNGETALKYDIPFVFAEVNADCIDWLVKADGSTVKLYSDSKRVGQNISTKAVGSDRRSDITNTYKYKEGSDKERTIFKHALTRDYSVTGDEEVEEEEDDDEEMEEVEEEDTGENITVEDVEEGAGNDEVDDEDESEDMGETETGDDTAVVTPVAPQPLVMHFEEVTPPTNGKNVRVRLVLQSDSTAPRPLSINISVQAMRYNGLPEATIQKEVQEKTLQPGKVLSIPIKVLFSDYRKSMLDSDSMKVSALITDKQQPENTYLVEYDIILLDPPITINLPKKTRVNRFVKGEVVFMNPINEILKNCTLTVSGVGLFRDETEYKLPDIKANNQLRMRFYFHVHKKGRRTLMVDFDCSVFKNIKGRSTINVV